MAVKRGDHDSGAATAAISAVRERARATLAADSARIARVLAAAGVAADSGTLCAAALATGRVVLNFKPDRLGRDGRSVAEALATDGVYASQFETGISNGGLTAFPGGDRDEWERRLFSGAYQRMGADARDRPRYGALNLAAFSNGPAPFFGSCALVLAPDAAARTTFLCGDSSVTHAALGTADAFEPVLAALLEEVAQTHRLLGRPAVGVRLLVDALIAATPLPPAFSRVTDSYLETHTHGPITLARDADELLLDPSYRDTSTGAELLAAAERWGLGVSWHAGSVLTLDRLRAAATSTAAARADRPLRRWQCFLRDGRAARLAARVIADHGDGDGLTAAAIGRAAVSFEREPAAWRQWGAPDPSLTALKDLWAIVAAHGISLDDAS